MQSDQRGRTWNLKKFMAKKSRPDFHYPKFYSPEYEIRIARTGRPASSMSLKVKNLNWLLLISVGVSLDRTLREYGPAIPNTDISSVTFSIVTSKFPLLAWSFNHLQRIGEQKNSIFNEHPVSLLPQWKERRLQFLFIKKER